MHQFKLRSPKFPRATENEIEQICEDILNLRGYTMFRLHSGTFKTVDGQRYIKGHDKGTPDYAVEHEYFPGFLLEVKRPGAVATNEQLFKHAELVCRKLAVAVISSREELSTFLACHEARARDRWRSCQA